ncbi:MAG: cation diffusion facilitator family transporter, partial [Pseudomonadota bacterium]
MSVNRVLATPKYYAYISVLISVLCLIIKYYAYLATGSVAIYSDAIESIINIVTSVIALATIVISSKPADDDHHYGHQKAEYISAVIEGLMIVVSSIAIAYEVYEYWYNPREIELSSQGIAAIALATVLNGIWSRVLILRGRKLQSPALIADGSHLYSDMITSLAVVLGLLLVKITNISIIDPVVAILVAAHILFHGSKVIHLSIDGLMDAAPKAR